MRRVPIGRSGLEGSAVALGCMRIDGLQTSELADLLCTAVDVGIDTFDHADIYADGRCETAFGDALRPAGISREAILIETKAGIRSGFFDLSADHLVASVDRSLGRLRTDYLDLFLLHRPDALVEPEEVALAFDRLHSAGKVLHFGVSNHNAGQIELLAAHVRQPLIVNQPNSASPTPG